MKTYSIIIPHKNSPHLLSRCLESIPQREDLEVIIVDDNSDFDDWDPNVFPFLNRSDTKMVFTKEGKGAGYARNIGLKMATGKWLLFADADDYYADGFMNVLDKYKDSGWDIIYFCIGGNSELVIPTNQAISYYLEHPVNGADELRLHNWVPWNKMFRRDFIMCHNFLFEEIYAGNDAMFVVKSGYYADRIAADLFPLYNYMFNVNSITNVKCKERDLSSYKLYLRINKFYRSVKKSRFAVNHYQICIDTLKKHEFKLFISYLKLMFKHDKLIYIIYYFFNSIYNGMKRML